MDVNQIRLACLIVMAFCFYLLNKKKGQHIPAAAVFMLTGFLLAMTDTF